VGPDLLLAILLVSSIGLLVLVELMRSFAARRKR